MKKLWVFLAFVAVVLFAQPGCLVGEGCAGKPSWQDMPDGYDKVKAWKDWVAKQDSSKVIYAFECDGSVWIEWTDPATMRTMRRGIDTVGSDRDLISKKPLFITAGTISLWLRGQILESMDVLDRFINSGRLIGPFIDLFTRPDSTYTLALKSGERINAMPGKCVETFRAEPPAVKGTAYHILADGSQGECSEATADLGGTEPAPTVPTPTPVPSCGVEQMCDR